MSEVKHEQSPAASFTNASGRQVNGQWGIQIARNFVPEAEQANLDMAAEFVRSARHNLKGPDTGPLMINVDDKDGDQVQVFIG